MGCLVIDLPLKSEVVLPLSLSFKAFKTHSILGLVTHSISNPEIL